MYDPIEITKKLISFQSITPQDHGVMQCVADYLKKLGFICKIIEFNLDNSEPVINLYAKLGNSGSNLCFAGHVDVVEPGDIEKWQYDPFCATINNDVLYGRGVADMKGGIASFIAAISKYLQHNNLENGSISLLITGDEECGSINGTKSMLEWLAKNGENIDLCLIGEPSCNTKYGDTIKIGRRGSLNGDIKITGKQGHSAYPHKANNPIIAIAKTILALEQYQWDNGNEYFQPSTIAITSVDVGNNTRNTIPATANLKFNIRFNNTYTQKTLEQEIIKVIESAIDLKYSFDTFSCNEPFFIESSYFRNIVSKAITKITGQEPEQLTTGGTSDGRFIKDYCKEIVELGLINASIHQINENADCKDIETLTKIYEQILVDIFAK